MGIDEKYYRTREVRELLDVTKLTVWNWISSGKLPAVKVGGQYRIAERDLKAFLENKKAGYRISLSPENDQRYKKRSAN